MAKALLILALLPFLSSTCNSFEFTCYDQDLGGLDGICNDFVSARLCKDDTNVSAPTSTHFTFGVIAPMSVQDATWYAKVHLGMLCAIEHVQNSPTILPGVTFDWIYADSKATQNGGFEAGLCLEQAGIDFVFGPHYSGAAAGAATVAKVFDMTLLSPTSSSPELGNRVNFPTFSRVFPSDLFQGTGIAHLARNFGWRHVATLHNRGDLYTEGVVAAFKEEAKLLGISVLAGATFTKETESYKDALQVVKDSGVKVILLSTYTADAEEILKVAKSLDMLGNGWVYLASEAWVLDAAGYDDNVGMGVIGLSPQVATESEAYETLSNCMANHWNDTSGMFGRYSWIDGPEISNFSPFEYDNMMAMFHAVDSIGPENVGDHEMLLKAVRNVDFLGATGPVKLNNVTGERLGLNFAIYNAQAGGLTNKVGELRTVDFSISEGDNYNTLIFDASGSKSIPLDLEVDCTLSEEQYYNTTVAEICVNSIRSVSVTRDGSFAERYCPEVESYEIPCDYPSTGDTRAIVAIILIAFDFIFEIACLAYMFKNFSHPYIVRGQRRLLVTMVFGCMVAKIPFIVELGGPPSDVTCGIKPVCLSIGGTIVFGTLLLKSWRVSVIFLSRKLRDIKITDSYLFVRLVLLVMVVVGLNALLIWQTPVQAQVKKRVTDSGLVVFERVCVLESSQISNILLFFMVLIVLATCYISFKLRNVQSDISQSKAIFLATYNCAVFAVAGVLLVYGIRLDPVTEYLLGAICTTLGCVGIVGFLLLPRYWLIHHKVPVTAPTAASKQTTGELASPGLNLTSDFQQENPAASSLSRGV